jgi:hypothetical protein
MLFHNFPKTIEQNCGPWLTWQDVPSISKQEFGFHLFRHATDEFGRGSQINWHGDGSAQDASEKRAKPFGGVPSPKQDAVARRYPKPFEFPGELCREASNL